jgi:hypothetical protein
VISLITGAGPVIVARFEHQFGDLGSYLSYLIYYYYTRNGFIGQSLVKIRGLLCYNCNLLLGNAKDKINLLTSAIDYLKRHQEEAGIAPASI